MGEFLDFVYHDSKYKLYVPGDYHIETESPLLVMLHGCGQNPEDFAAGTNMNTVAEKEKFLVLYPDMNNFFNPSNFASYNPFGCWNWFLDHNQHRGQGHPKLIYEMILDVKNKYRIDSTQIYAAGLSAGGSLACILGATYPDVFNGIGICAGLPYGAANVIFLTDPMAEGAKKSMEKGVPDPYSCGISAFQEMGEFKKKMRVIVFHGICDTVVHPINGQQVITQWAQTNFLVEGGTGHVDVTPAQIESDIINGKSYTRQIYNDRDDIPLLELWMIDQMGHTWSGGSPDGSYTDPLGPNASEIIWSFFSKQQQPSEENLTETPSLDPILLPVDLSISSLEPTPVETESIQVNESLEKTSIDLPENPPDELPEKSPEKNFFNNLFAKLKKTFSKK